jgi:hypothetical protein
MMIIFSGSCHHTGPLSGFIILSSICGKKLPMCSTKSTTTMIGKEGTNSFGSQIRNAKFFGSRIDNWIRQDDTMIIHTSLCINWIASIVDKVRKTVFVLTNSPTSLGTYLPVNHITRNCHRIDNN